jgi:hypothetical protein
MKRNVFLAAARRTAGILALGLVFGLVVTGCGGDDSPSGPQVTVPPASSLPEKPATAAWVTSETAAKDLYEEVEDYFGGYFVGIVQDLARDAMNPPNKDTPTYYDGSVKLSDYTYEQLAGEVKVSTHDIDNGNSFSGEDDIEATTDIIAQNVPNVTVLKGSVWRQSYGGTETDTSETWKYAVAYGLTVVKDGVAAKIVYQIDATGTETKTSEGDWDSTATGWETITVYGDDGKTPVYYAKIAVKPNEGGATGEAPMPD